jgi:NAD(P)-dependent dehydrogenase (short-subunit alcohol dehydrogenase family)
MSGRFSLAGRRALVTGANTGIGQAIAVALAEAGAAVICAGRSPAPEKRGIIGAAGGPARARARGGAGRRAPARGRGAGPPRPPPPRRKPF